LVVEIVTAGGLIMAASIAIIIGSLFGRCAKLLSIEYYGKDKYLDE
jgi:hypothetical protein